ncbi:putative DnaJ like protein [Scheffersomyces coipomensis]|uniref:putative DnaJ like protein n=1 Tax=Scheffersomyces coipomensis TaxID=1788519 RepID=UPI00315D4DA8
MYKSPLKSIPFQFSINHIGISSIRYNSSSSSDQLNYYQILEIPTNSTIKEIKHQFKKLSKKYHPDLNPSLDNDEKEALNDKFINIVTAYDTLKDIKRKKEYDQDILGRSSHRNNYGFGSNNQSNREREWHNKYYGEAKYYSKSGSSSGSGLNTKRNKVYFNDQNDSSDFDLHSKFSGHHVNYGDRFDVPHFDYNQHLHKHLKFEQRIINKHLSKEDRDKILQNLLKSSSNNDISEELITKHLMRHVQLRDNNPMNQSQSYSSSSTTSTSSPRPNHASSSSSSSTSSSYSSTSRNPHMYYAPPRQDSDSSMFKTLMLFTGAGSSLFLLYKAVS